MNALPAPLTPADCDLRGNEWMPLHGAKLFASDFYALASDTEYRAAERLWWAAWQGQVPAASLPNNDRVLCHLAGFERDQKTWAKIRATVLWNFVECSDGRLYHRFLAEEAIVAYDLRLKAGNKREKDRERLLKWRAERKRNAPQNTDETTIETRFVEGRQDKTVQEERKAAASGLLPREADDPPPRQFAPPTMPCRGDPPNAWVPLAESVEINREGVRKPVVAGYYLDDVAEMVCDAAKIHSASWRGNWAPLIEWLKSGLDFHDQILPAIKRVASRSGYEPPGTLKYFDKAVRERAAA